MKITRALTTVEFSEFDHANLCTVTDMISDLLKDLQEHDEDSIQGNGKCIDVYELEDIISYLKILASTRIFMVF